MPSGPPFDATWSAVVDTVPAARHAVMAHLSAAETSDPPLSDIGLVVSEAVINVVNHAYRDSPEPGPVRVRLDLHADEIELMVEDEGSGMTPRPDSPGLGLGIPLIATVSERFDIRSGADGGTRLCVWFDPAPAASTLPG